MGLWCSGFRPHYPWLRVPGALDVDGSPRHQAGVSPVSGLEWTGLPWQTRLNSSIADGIDRDAKALVSRLESQDARDPTGSRSGSASWLGTAPSPPPPTSWSTP